MTLRTLRDRLSAFTETPRGRRVARGLRVTAVGGIVAFLVYRLSQIGWGEVWAALPTTPWFYLIAVAMYLLLPLGETVIYRALWEVRGWPLFSVLLRKKVLNQDVLNYSGEVYFLAWARRRVEGSRRQVTMEVKDNLIVSSIASTVAAMLILGGFFALGAFDALDAVTLPSGPAVAGVVAVAVLAAALLVRFRRALFHIEGRMMGVLWAVHFGRFFLSNVLQVLQWYVVVPEAPFQAWAVLLTALVITNRIPLLPSKDLLFVGVGVELSSMLGIPMATVAGMLLVRSVVDKVLNLALFVGLGAGARREAAAAAAAV